MSKIKDAFTKGKAFIPFISAGDHGIENTERYIRIMVKAGADMVEIGIPFSDPTAEGPVIQEASTRALSTGVKIHDIFDMVCRLRTGDDAVTVPLVFMTYLNPIYVFGRENSLPSVKRLAFLALLCRICRLKKKVNLEQLLISMVLKWYP